MSRADDQPGIPASGGSMRYVSLLASVAALGGLLFGYDTAVIAGAIGFLQNHFQLDPQLWKGWAAASALLGCAVGAALAGTLSDRVGRKKVLILSAILFLVSAIGTALPRDFLQFVVFRIIGGLGVGAASLTSPLYIAEVSPARIRGRMVSVNQFAIVTGMLVVYFVNYFIGGYGEAVDRAVIRPIVAEHGETVDAGALAEFFQRSAKRSAQIDPGESASLAAYGAAVDALTATSGGKLEPEQVVEFLAGYGVDVDRTEVLLAAQGRVSWNVARGWRWMFGSESLPAVLLFALLFLVPESPRWLTKQGLRDRARSVLTRVDGPAHAEAELAEIERTIALETGSIGQLFAPGVRIVLVIGIVLAVLQQVTGINVFLYYATDIFKKLGSGTSAALLETVLVGAVNLGFTVVAIWTVDRVGRKPLMIVGFSGMGVCLFAMGLASYLQNTDVWVLAFILGYIASFAMSVGPVTWVILSEIFPTRTRGRAMAIATVCLWLANFVVTQTFTWMDDDAWLVATFHHAFPFWVYAVLCVVSILFLWRFVPETKGRSLEEIERSWLG